MIAGPRGAADARVRSTTPWLPQSRPFTDCLQFPGSLFTSLILRSLAQMPFKVVAGRAWPDMASRADKKGSNLAMVKRNYLITLGIAAALALPAGPALAAGKGHKGQAHGHTKVVHHSTHGKSLRQLEGTVVSVDGSSFVLRPMASKAMPVTVAISTSTVVTAEA